jgi:hypothetical protein
MFHAISAAWARLARRITARQALPFEYATWYGWQTRRLSRSRWQFRDPRFGQLATERTTSVRAPHTWAQAAITRRIHALGMHPATEITRCPSCGGTGEEYYQARDGEFVLAACNTCGTGRVGSKGPGVLGGPR